MQVYAIKVLFILVADAKEAAFGTWSASRDVVNRIQKVVLRTKSKWEKNDERINFFWKADNNGIYLFVFFNNKP